MMNKTLAVTAIVAFAACAAPAFATDCTDDQASAVGMVAATIAKQTVSKVIAVTGKQMVNVESCDFHSGAYAVDFKYNFLAADGLYWAEISTKFSGDGANAVTKVTRASPNMVAAETKSGIKLASN